MGIISRNSFTGITGQRGFTRMTPQVDYICHSCNVPGHFIQHCPINGDPSYDIRKQKPPTKMQSTLLANDLPVPELYCPVCKALMKDAAFTKYCFRSLCDKSSGTISTKSACFCGSMKMSVDDIIPNVTLREIISGIRESTTSSNNEQAKVLSPTLPAVIKEEPKNFLDSNYGTIEVVDDGASEGTLELNKRKKIKKERATQDYGTQNCGGMPPLSSSDGSNFMGRRVPMGTDAYMVASSIALLTGLVPRDPSVIHAYTNPDYRRKRPKMSA